MKSSSYDQKKGQKKTSSYSSSREMRQNLLAKSIDALAFFDIFTDEMRKYTIDRFYHKHMDRLVYTDKYDSNPDLFRLELHHALKPFNRLNDYFAKTSYWDMWKELFVELWRTPLDGQTIYLIFEEYTIDNFHAFRKRLYRFLNLCVSCGLIDVYIAEPEKDGIEYNKKFWKTQCWYLNKHHDFEQIETFFLNRKRRDSRQLGRISDRIGPLEKAEAKVRDKKMRQFKELEFDTTPQGQKFNEVKDYSDSLNELRKKGRKKVILKAKQLPEGQEGFLENQLEELADTFEVENKPKKLLK